MHQTHLDSKLKEITICLQIFCKETMRLNCSLKLLAHNHRQEKKLPQEE